MGTVTGYPPVTVKEIMFFETGYVLRKFQFIKLLR